VPTDPTAASAMHLDRTTLAELDEGLLGTDAAAQARRHLAGCAECRDRLASITRVRTALAAAPAEPLPASVGARLDAALKAADRSAPVTLRRGAPPLAARRSRWQPGGGLLAAGAAASIVLLLFGALVVGALKGGNGGSTTSAGGSGSEARSADVAGGGVVASGRNYTAATVVAAVPALVAGQGRAQLAPSESGSPAADIKATAPRARLAGPGALEPCIAELAGRSGVRPLAVDLARFAGKPAAVLVLPETGQPSTLDVWVVGPGCTRGDPQLIYFTRLPRPAGIRSP